MGSAAKICSWAGCSHKLSYSDDPGHTRLQLCTRAKKGKPNPTALFPHKGAPGNTTKDRFPCKCIHIKCGHKRTNGNRLCMQIDSSKLCTYMPKVHILHANIRYPVHTFPPIQAHKLQSGAILGQSTLVALSFAKAASATALHLFPPLLLFYLFPAQDCLQFWLLVLPIGCQEKYTKLSIKLAKCPPPHTLG